MNFDELKDGFFLEATELLDEAEDSLLKSKENIKDDVLFNKVFRAFHSLKGAAGMFGLTVLQEHIHILENNLEHCRNGFSSTFIDYYLAEIDAARSFFESSVINFDHDILNEKKSSTQTNVQINEPQKVVVPKIDPADHQKKIEDRSKFKIYVVDDEPIIVDIVFDAINHENYIISKFHDGSEVLEALDMKNLPDLIISDINMPKVNGIEMAKKITAMGIKVPIIFVSAYVTKEIVLTGLKAGNCYFIEKPFDEKYLISLTASVLHHQRAKKELSYSLDRVIYMLANHEEVMNKAGLNNEIKMIQEELEELLKVKKEFVG